MPLQISLFSGKCFRDFPKHLHLPKGIDWKVTACFTLAVASLIIAYRFIRPAPNNSQGHPNTGASGLQGRVDQAPPAVTESHTRDEAPSQAKRNAWTINSNPNGELIVTFEMNSDALIEKMKTRENPTTGFGERDLPKSEIFNYHGEKFYLVLRPDEALHVDYLMFSLERVDKHKESEISEKIEFQCNCYDSNLNKTVHLDFSGKKEYQKLCRISRFRRGQNKLVQLTVCFPNRK